MFLNVTEALIKLELLSAAYIADVARGWGSLVVGRYRWHASSSRGLSNPAAYSILSDVFSAEVRSTALSVYHFGVYLGGGIGYMSGALNSAVGWRMTFLILSVPGFLMGLVILFTLKEPERGINEKSKASVETDKPKMPVMDLLKYFWDTPALMMLTLATSVRNLPGYALGAWLPTFYERVFGLETTEFGLPVGAIVVVGGGLGSIAGGYLADYYSRRSPRAKTNVIVITQVLAAPCIAGTLLAPTYIWSFVILFFAYVTAETWLGTAASIVQVSQVHMTTA